MAMIRGLCLQAQKGETRAQRDKTIERHHAGSLIMITATMSDSMNVRWPPPTGAQTSLGFLTVTMVTPHTERNPSVLY